MGEKVMYIIAGCNGAGKTTASYTILPDIINCNEFINADEIARGLSPFRPENVAIEAGKIMLKRIDELLTLDECFAFETTLSTLSFKHKINIAKQNGFKVFLLFFWLQNIELAKKRVMTRVKEGGHSIPDEVIERRYIRGIKNLFKIYLPMVDKALIFDNSFGRPNLIAEKISYIDEVAVLKQNEFFKLKKYK